jgi:hypothetical protein
MTKPAVFVGSSTEGLEFARAIRALLAADAEVTLWNEDFFRLGKTFIETLVDALPRFDFAVLVLTPDDLVTSREAESFGPRDNVIFELGLFMGQLGRARTFVLYQEGAHVKVPTDLSGVTLATYHWPRNDSSCKAAVGSACDNIRQIIRELGSSERRITKELGDIRSRQAEQQLQIDAISFLINTYIPWPELGHLWGLKLDKPFPFSKSQWFEAELRRLRSLGVIKGRPGVTVGGLPETGDLKNFFHITDGGLRYLGFCQRFSDLPSDFPAGNDDSHERAE